MRNRLLVKHLALSFIVVSLFTSFKQNEKGTLVPSTTVITTTDNPDYLETEGAARISTWLKKIYGATTGFEIIKQSDLTDIKGKTVIAIGKTKFSPQENFKDSVPYTFIIDKKENIIAIQGINNIATFMGAGYFLDHFCGVRFYMPGDLFTSLPQTKNIQLDKNIFIKETPFTKYILTTGYKSKEEIYWADINGLYRKNWGSHQHSMGDRFFNDTIMKQFPEIFPIYLGQRYFPSSRTDQKWQPDFAEPKLVDAAVFSAVQYFKKNPTIDYISFSVQDSKNYPTEGKMGEFLKSYPSTPEGQKRAYTDAYIAFLNKLAEKLQVELPKNGITRPKTIVYIAYGNVRGIPQTKLNPGILPIIVFHIAETLMDSVYNEGPTEKKDYRLSEWAKVTTRIGNHDWAEGKGIIYPRIYTNLVSKFVRTIQNDKMSFEYAHVEAYPNWAMDGPKYYFMGKIYWNPEVNPDSLLTLFCSDMFGRAKDDMKAYFSTLEDLNTSMNNDPTRNRRLAVYTTQLNLNQKELQLVGRARQLINDAANKAATDDEKKRIDLFSKGLKIFESFLDIYNNSKDLNDPKVMQLKNYLQQTVAGNNMMLNQASDTDFARAMNAQINNIIRTKEK
jgi:hypothetical protein